MAAFKLMAECIGDKEKLNVWRGLLEDTPMQIRSLVNQICVDENGEWIIGSDPTIVYITLPYFQRAYNASNEFKTNLIESILVGVPIGNIKMHANVINGVETLGIVDGQHRLKTIFDFHNDSFRLEGRYLSFLKSLSGKKYSELDVEYKSALLNTFLRVEKSNQQMKDKKELIEEFSKHCFIRMNENVNKMSPYVLAKAKCINPLSPWLDKYFDEVFEGEVARTAFIVGDRSYPDSHKNDMVSVLELLLGGLKDKFNKQEDIVTSHFEYISKLDGKQSQLIYKAHSQEKLSNFIAFLESFNTTLNFNYPFSTDIIKPNDGRSTKRLATGNLIRFTLAYSILDMLKLNIYDKNVLLKFLELYREISNDSDVIGDGSLKNRYLKDFKEEFSRKLIHTQGLQALS